MALRERVAAALDFSYTPIQGTGDGEVEARLHLLDLYRRAAPQQRAQPATMQFRTQRVAHGFDVQMQVVDVFAVPVDRILQQLGDAFAPDIVCCFKAYKHDFSPTV
jgi:predicted NBD/HSP70 family sugar kinase